MMGGNGEVGARLWATARYAALLGVILLAGVRGTLLHTGLGNLLEFLLGVVIGGLAVGVAVLLVRLCCRLGRALPGKVLATLAAVVLVLFFLDTYSPGNILRIALDPGSWGWPFNLPHGLEVVSLLVLVLAFALVVAVASELRGRRLQALARRQRGAVFAATAVALALSALVVSSLWSEGADPFPNSYRLMSGSAGSDVQDPSAPGQFTVEYLTYGAGDNLRRPEFGIERQLESRTVNAAPLLRNWKGIKQRMRERYWGFGLDKAPLNGLVWTPQGSGPFPLVLIVHGNHGMEEYSDPGYRYLGELLASRGFLTVSVDQNYINGTWSGDFRGLEMPLRAWLLLEHLALWRDWNQSSGHRFYQKVDMEAIALVGHSRGGEAVSIAYAYNSLPHYPDDATVDFDYGFAIRSLVAIAQVDQRYHRRVKLEDVNFLALQGSYDSDEPAFHGMRQFNRITLSDDAYHFKAGVYIHRANHGQFNSIWGRQDAGPPHAWLLNTAPIIPAQDQRQIAKVYIAAFLESTLRGNAADYLALFRDPRYGAGWLPDQAYVNQFMDSTFLPIASFEEDLDVTSATADGAVISARGFGLWREEDLLHRDERPQGTNVVVLGRAGGETASFEILLPAGFWPDWIQGDDLLTLSASGSTESLPVSDDDSEPGPGADDEPGAPRFLLEMEDEQGRVVSISSDEMAQLAPPLRVRYMKSERLNRRLYRSDWEPVLQVVEVPLARLISEGAQVADLRSLRLRFEGPSDAVVILDDIGIRRGTRNQNPTLVAPPG